MVRRPLKWEGFIEFDVKISHLLLNKGGKSVIVVLRTNEKRVQSWKQWTAPTATSLDAPIHNRCQNREAHAML